MRKSKSWPSQKREAARDRLLSFESKIHSHLFLPAADNPEFKNNCFTEMCSGSEAGSYLRLVDFGITQL